jgi:hypothetical protein
MAAPYPRLLNGTGVPQGITDVAAGAANAVTRVGTRATLEDGRVFYYARNSGAAALAAGKPVCSELALANNDNLAVNTALTGDTTVTITSGTPTANANDFAGGYLCVVDGTSEGRLYRIKKHPAITATASIVITLDDPLTADFAAATTVSIVKNPWMDVVISYAGQAHFCAGVPPTTVPIGSTTAQYFWCQTWGMAGVWADEATALGGQVATGTTEGHAELQDAAGEQSIGVQYLVAQDTMYQPVFLQIAP